MSSKKLNQFIIKIQGGLGNQLFQYALYKSLKSRNFNVLMFVGRDVTENQHNGFELEKIFDLKLNIFTKSDSRLLYYFYNTKSISQLMTKKSIIKYFYIFLEIIRRLLHKYRFITKLIGFKVYKEKQFFLYDSDLFKQKGSVFYDGYWQNELYFKTIKHDLLNDLKTYSELDDLNLKVIEKLENQNSVSVHIRRGDYIGHKSLGGICGVDYYDKAIKKIKSIIKDAEFYFFSNDITWVSNHFKDGKYHFIDLNKGSQSYKDMILMSKCKHNIIANSTFSWWGAYMNENIKKIVIAPKKWTNRDNETNIIPSNWTKL